MNRIDRLLARSQSEGVFSCASYSVGTSDAELYAGSVGVLGQGRGPAGLDTVFDLASVSKPMVAVALMRLLEQGLICLDDTVDRFLPMFSGSEKGKTSLFSLLTHTSTIHGQVQLYRTCKNKHEILQGILYMPPRDISRPSVEYSSQGFMILGEVIEVVTGVTLDRAMEELVFDPLGMKDTFFNPTEEIFSRIASTEDCPWRKRVIVGEVHDENAVVMGGVCGHAGLFSTAADVAKLARAMLSTKVVNGVQFLLPATIALMTRNHTKGMNLARGLGWQLKDFLGSPAGDLFSDSSFGHTGFTGTSVFMDPVRDLFAVLLTNRVHPSREGEDIMHVRQMFHNLAALMNDAQQQEPASLYS